MEANGHIAFYVILAVGIILLIFVSALVFVDSARKGNRRFKWTGRSQRPPSGT
jgi:heme exporter protein D